MTESVSLDLMMRSTCLPPRYPMFPYLMRDGPFGSPFGTLPWPPRLLFMSLA